MRKTLHALFLLVVFCLLGIACSIIAPEPTPTPTPLPCLELSKDFVANMDELVERFQDADKLAGSTARIALSGPIAQLQEIKREASDLDAPNCALEVKERLIRYMENTIDSYLTFMADEPELDLEQKIAIAQTSEQAFQVAREALGYGDNQYPSISLYRVTGLVIDSGDTDTRINLSYRDENGEIKGEQSIELPWLMTIESEDGFQLDISVVSISDETPLFSQLSCLIVSNGRIIDESNFVSLEAAEARVQCSGNAE